MKNQSLDNFTFETTFDLKAEAFAAVLLKKSENTGDSFDAEQVVIFPNGSVKRKSAREVVDVRIKEYESDFSLFIEVNKLGLFDVLPPGLFLTSDEKFDSLLEKTNALSQQTKLARKFLLPFDQSLYHPRIRMEQIEQNWNEHLPESLLRIWDLDKYSDILSDRQAYLLLYLIPIASHTTGDMGVTRLIFGAVLNKEVVIDFNRPRRYELPASREKLYMTALGADDEFIGDEFQDDLPGLKISILGLDNREMADYLQGGRQRIIIEEILCSYFLPLEFDVQIDLVLNEESKGISLDASHLGYGTDLGKIQNDNFNALSL